LSKEVGEAIRLVVLERDGGYGLAALVPDAEPHLPLFLG
jgi:hypothetical protein